MNEQLENSILSALSGYTPKPGQQFYRSLSDAPWYRKKQTPRMIPVRRWMTITAMVLLVLVILGFSIPTVRAYVMQFLGLHFSSSETVENPAIPAGMLVDSRKVDEIGGLAGWTINTPGWLPEGYTFSDALYDSANRMVLLTFTAARQLPGNDPSMTVTKAITLVQARHNDILPLTVAPGTNVENITISGQPAAYALGAWENDFSTGTATWNNAYELQNVYWQIGDVYLNLNTDDQLVSREDLMKMAESVR